MLKKIGNETHTRNCIFFADVVLEKPVSDFPREYRSTLVFVFRNFTDHILGCHSWFTASDRFRFYRPRFVVAPQYFRYTSI